MFNFVPQWLYTTWNYNVFDCVTLWLHSWTLRIFSTLLYAVVSMPLAAASRAVLVLYAGGVSSVTAVHSYAAALYARDIRLLWLHCLVFVTISYL